MTHTDPRVLADARLARRDAHISRCPLCGAWVWRGRCATPHAPTLPP